MGLTRFVYFDVFFFGERCAVKCRLLGFGLAWLSHTDCFCDSSCFPTLEKGQVHMSRLDLASWFQHCLAASRVSLQMKNPMMLRMKDNTANVSTLIQVMR